MARARRTWDTLRPEIYDLLRESETGSYWSATTLLRLWNDCLDLRCLQLGIKHEGWNTTTISISLAANQAEYALPTAADKVRRILIVDTNGSVTAEYPVIRDEKPISPVFHGSAAAGYGGGIGVVPTARLRGASLILEPRPTVSVTNGIKLEYESAPTHFVNGSSELEANLPIFMETLLKYDTAIGALSIEGAQGAVSAEIQSEISDFQAKYERVFEEYTDTRFHGQVHSTPYPLGD